MKESQKKIHEEICPQIAFGSIQVQYHCPHRIWLPNEGLTQTNPNVAVKAATVLLKYLPTLIVSFII